MNSLGASAAVMTSWLPSTEQLTPDSLAEKLNDPTTLFSSVRTALYWLPSHSNSKVWALSALLLMKLGSLV